MKMTGADHTPHTPWNETDGIERALEDLPDGLDVLQVASALRRVLPAETARLAAEWYELRARAKKRFPSGQLRFLTRAGLERSTREVVARFRAASIAAWCPGASVYDATAGLGSDAIALAERGLRVVAGELDAHTARCAAANARPWSSQLCVILADALAAPVKCDFLIIDPDRRADGQRTRTPKRWSPPLDRVLELCARFRGACVKLSPGVDIGEVAAWVPTGLPAKWQWVSAGWELCEANLWLGEWALEGSGPLEREAVALGSGGDVLRVTGTPFPVVSPPSEEVSGNFWLFSPDPAVIRAGLVGNLAAQLGATGLDPHLAFLRASGPLHSGLVRGRRVLESVPADPKRVREALRRHDIGPVQVIKRGHPDPAEVLERRLRGPGRRRGTIAIARVGATHMAYILEPDGPETQAVGPHPFEGVGDEGIEPPTSSL